MTGECDGAQLSMCVVSAYAAVSAVKLTQVCICVGCVTDEVSVGIWVPSGWFVWQHILRILVGNEIIVHKIKALK